jgi:ssDNA-binding Zn-finger/Zn-ribbon topoisomerase 1
MRTSVLAKYRGCLVLFTVKKTRNSIAGNSPKAKCPQCGSRELIESSWSGPDWYGCANKECDFEVLKVHYDEVMFTPIETSGIDYSFQV